MCILNKIALIGAIVVALISCDVALSPTDIISSDKVFETVDDMDQVLTGAYDLNSYRNSLIITSRIVDDVVQGGQAGGSGDYIFGWTYLPNDGDVGNLWSKSYKVIEQVNQIIINSESIEPSAADQSYYNDILAQSYFMRAFYHFELLRFFADFNNDSSLGVPYSKTTNILAQPSRDIVGDVYAEINSDIEKALLMIDKTITTNTRATEAAIFALKARVALYHKDFDTAIESATSAINIVPLATIDQYPSVWTDNSEAGVIWKLKSLSGDATLGTMFVGGDGSDVFQPSNELRAIYDQVNDIRHDIFFTKGPDRDGLIVDQVIKYPGTAATPGLSDQKMFRTSELYLIRAEANNSKGNVDTANDDLETLRSERVISNLYSDYTSSELEQQILLERRKELVYEGHRFLDLRRLGLPIERDNGLVLPVTSYRMLMPIPLGEVNANENIVQNPKYD